MYLSHWGLREPPFAGAVDPRAYFESPTHDEALARLNFLVEGHRRAGLLLGASGTGKSLVLAVLAGELRRRGVCVATTSLLGVDGRELRIALCEQWGVEPPRDVDNASLARLISDRLAELHIERRRVVALLDDADEAVAEATAQIARLAQLDLDGQPALTLVLAARTGNVGRMGLRLLELVDLRIDLLRWTVEDTRGFLDHALARAGRCEPAFTSEAVALLAELAEGIPRNIVQLADLALLAAAGSSRPLVDSDTLHSVYEELGVVQRFVDAA